MYSMIIPTIAMPAKYAMNGIPKSEAFVDHVNQLPSSPVISSQHCPIGERDGLGIFYLPMIRYATETAIRAAPNPAS